MSSARNGSAQAATWMRPSNGSASTSSRAPAGIGMARTSATATRVAASSGDSAPTALAAADCASAGSTFADAISRSAIRQAVKIPTVRHRRSARRHARRNGAKNEEHRRVFAHCVAAAAIAGSSSVITFPKRVDTIDRYLSKARAMCTAVRFAGDCDACAEVDDAFLTLAKRPCDASARPAGA